MHKVNATFEIVTPMFIGGYDAGHAESPPRLTAAAVTGALRFWWRALAWSRLPEGDNQEKLATLHAWENELFGSAEKGQGKFLPRLLDQSGLGPPKLAATRLQRGQEAQWPLGGYPRISAGEQRHWQHSGSGLAYLAGLGLTRNTAVRPVSGRDFRQFIDQRPALLPGQRFIVQFLSLKQWRIDQPVAEGAPSLWDAIQAFGLLGGLGSRSRRGFGSVALRHIEPVEGDGPNETLPHFPKAYGERVSALINKFRGSNDESPPYSAISMKTLVGFRADKVERADQLPTAVRALHNRVGHELQLFRGWGFHGRVGGEVALQHFPEDHKWFKKIEAAGGRQPRDPVSDRLPRRAVFGLPHNYQTRSGVTVDVSPNARDGQKKNDRRASPLLIHLHSFERYGPVANLLLLESEFLAPEVAAGLKVQPGRRGIGAGKPWEIPSWQPDYSIIRAFMRKKAPPPFP